LAQHGVAFVILEAESRLGAAWLGRWDSLTLFTPRRYSALPGLPFPGDPAGYPSREEVAAYLERYAAEFSLPIEFNSHVQSLTPLEGGFRLDIDGRPTSAGQVIVASGAFQTPFVPPFAAQLAPEVVQLHSTAYRRPGGIPSGTVLVVGGGNTGFQIAEELAATHTVHLSIGSKQMPLPQRFLGRDIFSWLTTIGYFKKNVETRMGQRLSQRLALIGSSPRSIQRAGVRLQSRATAASGRAVAFEDGSTLDIDSVIWATGFRPDYSWINAPVTDEHGRPRHRRGVTPVPGLYFVGLEWQWTRGSALIGWVKDDAAFIAERVLAGAGAARQVETDANPREKEEP
jgi:putative flavoprotein involved in K+ transport